MEVSIDELSKRDGHQLLSGEEADHRCGFVRTPRRKLGGREGVEGCFSASGKVLSVFPALVEYSAAA